MQREELHHRNEVRILVKMKKLIVGNGDIEK